MPTMQRFGRSMMAGFGLALTFAIINGLSTYIIKDGATLEDWVDTKVGA